LRLSWFLRLAVLVVEVLALVAVLSGRFRLILRYGVAETRSIYASVG
jgi:hypothetical protein